MFSYVANPCTRFILANRELDKLKVGIKFTSSSRDHDSDISSKEGNNNDFQGSCCKIVAHNIARCTEQSDRYP